MNRQTLHWLIAIEICLNLVATKLDWTGVAQVGLDQELSGWIAAQGEKELSTSESAVMIAALAFFPFLVFSWIWLWMLKPYSRIVYVLTSVPGFLLLPLSGAIVSNGWPDLFYGLSSIVAGMIIGGLYFSYVYPYSKRAELEGDCEPGHPAS
ncbi:MAG: hypothetical protein AAGA96_18510 [Verrucomicrobiota bacterium]